MHGPAIGAGIAQRVVKAFTFPLHAFGGVVAHFPVVIADSGQPGQFQPLGSVAENLEEGAGHVVVAGRYQPGPAEALQPCAHDPVIGTRGVFQPDAESRIAAAVQQVMRHVQDVAGERDQVGVFGLDFVGADGRAGQVRTATAVPGGRYGRAARRACEGR